MRRRCAAFERLRRFRQDNYLAEVATCNRRRFGWAAGVHEDTGSPAACSYRGGIPADDRAGTREPRDRHGGRLEPDYAERDWLRLLARACVGRGLFSLSVRGY